MLPATVLADRLNSRCYVRPTHNQRPLTRRFAPGQNLLEVFACEYRGGLSNYFVDRTCVSLVVWNPPSLGQLIGKETGIGHRQETSLERAE
jgi:hypothetical protein